MGSQRPHQRSIRWDYISPNFVFCPFLLLLFLKFCLLYILTCVLKLQEHMVTWSVSLTTSCGPKTPSWWIYTKECILIGRMIHMSPPPHLGSNQRLLWIWRTWKWNRRKPRKNRENNSKNKCMIQSKSVYNKVIFMQCFCLVELKSLKVLLQSSSDRLWLCCF